MYSIFNIRHDYSIFQKLQCKICCEVGVQKGKNAQRIYNGIKPKELILIDPWKNFPREEYSDRANKPQKTMDKYFEETQIRLKKGIDNKVITIYRNRSDDILPTFKNYFDFMYIDGNHGFDFVLKDLKMCLHSIKKDKNKNPIGYICGHDFISKKHKGVTKAVISFLKENPNLSVIPSGNINFIISSISRLEELYKIIDTNIKGNIYANWDFFKNWS